MSQELKDRLTRIIAMCEGNSGVCNDIRFEASMALQAVESQSVAVIAPAIEWGNIATRFNVGADPSNGLLVTIEARNQEWVINQSGFLLWRDATWHYEPLPSSCTNRFLKNTRFETKEKAYEFWDKYTKQNLTKIK